MPLDADDRVRPPAPHPASPETAETTEASEKVRAKDVLTTLDGPERQDASLALFSFGLTVALATYEGWVAADLVWSLWLSSLAFGLVLFLGVTGAALVGHVRRRRVLRPIATSVFMLAFFVLHYGAFHYGHAQFLVDLFPPGDGLPPLAEFSGPLVSASNAVLGLRSAVHHTSA
jgi:hypothetical protein